MEDKVMSLAEFRDILQGIFGVSDTTNEKAETLYVEIMRKGYTIIFE